MCNNDITKESPPDPCPFCRADLQGRPQCRVCGCELDFDSAPDAKAIRLTSRLAQNLSLPVFEVPEPEPPRQPKVITVGIDLSYLMEGDKS